MFLFRCDEMACEQAVGACVYIGLSVLSVCISFVAVNRIDLFLFEQNSRMRSSAAILCIESTPHNGMVCQCSSYSIPTYCLL